LSLQAIFLLDELLVTEHKVPITLAFFSTAALPLVGALRQWRHAVAQLVDALYHNPEARRFASQWRRGDFYLIVSAAAP
jgi:ABC-type taurine transport system substrate-binding protein